MRRKSSNLALAACLCMLLAIFSRTQAQETVETLTIYSGRREELVAPIIAQFVEETGIQAEVRYGNMAEMVATILEEGDNSPADVLFVQDASGLGALAREGRLRRLPSDILERVPLRFQSPQGVWVGTSGRARVLVYNPDLVSADELPRSLLDLTQPQWAGRVGMAPSNGPFQGQITAMRRLLGEDAARGWLQAMLANDTRIYPENTAVVQAVIDGEVAAGLVNHYYIYQFRAEDPTIRVENYFFPDGDIGALVNVAGAGILDTSRHPGLAQRFILYLLSKSAQTYFATETYEYPLVAGISAQEGLPPLDAIQTPDLDLSDLDDLRGTVDLLMETGVLR